MRDWRGGESWNSRVAAKQNKGSGGGKKKEEGREIMRERRARERETVERACGEDSRQ